MIGGAAALYLLVSGRIMGASGILGGLVDGSGRDTLIERGVFIAGLIAAPVLYGLVFGFPATNLTSNVWVLAAAGLFVGVGTRLANGCTSGHGVCGLSRFSWRSVVATVVFMLSAGATVAIVRHVIGG